MIDPEPKKEEEAKAPAGFEDIPEPEAWIPPALDEKGEETETEVEEETQDSPPPEKGTGDKEGAEISSGDLQHAYDLGLTEEEAREFGTPAALKHALGVIEAKLIGSMRGTEEEVEPPKAGPKGKKEAGDDEIPELDEKHFDENIVKLSRAVKKMSAELAVVKGHAVRQQQEANEKDFVNWLGKLPKEEYGDTFGGKAGDVWDSNSEAFKNASAVWDAERDLALGMARRGLKLPPKERIRDRALMSVFGGKAQENARKAMDTKINRRKAMATAPSSSRETSANTQYGSETAKALNRIYKRNGGFEPERPEKL